ncbi:MAG: septum site-determining protein MinC [Chloroflexi bacterium]|nr:septum site-determining protein MinC [Chloroflexota bacterium]
MDNSISIKGTRDGVAIALGEGELDRLSAELERYLERQGAFFRGGVVTLSVGGRTMLREDIERMQSLLAEHEMALRTVSSSDDVTVAAATELGLHTAGAERPAGSSDGGISPAAAADLGERRLEASEEPQGVHADADGIARAGARALVVRRRVRAGQTIRHSGTVVVIGDVNAGAEVIAGGDVVVWGRLRGMVHAGCLGNASAVVCALDLSPLQVRIADLITRPEEGGARDDSYPEVAYVRDHSIYVERWTAIRWRD